MFHAECSTKARQKLDVFKGRTEKRQFDDVKPVIEEKKEENQVDNENNKAVVEMKKSEEKETEVEMVDLDIETGTNVAANDVNSFIYDEALCSLCNLTNFDIECGLNKDELNHLLSFILSRIKSWVCSLLQNKFAYSVCVLCSFLKT